ncbi:MAG: class I SAM-dependent methyltransferase [Candidatus Hodarchaeales archaeon]|jgi:SAM-dependent methyltransferase
MEPTIRFTDKAKYYHSGRPGYPKEVLAIIKNITKIAPGPTSIIADIGSGTGKLSEVFLKFGVTVIGVEPNKAMREIAESKMEEYENFISIDGTAEFTGIKDRSVDLITVGQSFHWFNLPKTRKEFQRILKPDRYVVIVWNNRNAEISQFFREYKTLLTDFGTDFNEVTKAKIGKEDFADFFGSDNYERLLCPNKQLSNYEGLRLRLLSTSYIPPEESDFYPAMIKRLKELYKKHQVNELVTLDYETEILIGKIV